MKYLTGRSVIPALIALVMTGAASANAQHLVINEIMQSNVETIMDDLNEFPDSWVELYNAGSREAILSDYSIGMMSENKAYRLPVVNVSPGERVIVYCDKVGEGMHADFRLESGKGGSLYLYSNGAVADAFEDIPKMPSPDVSYGRAADGTADIGFLPAPTPGRANPGQLCSGVLGEPDFSHKGRVLTDALELTLSLPEDAPEGTVIRFTTDGTEPSVRSSVYSGPILISATTVIRARLFSEGYASPYATTHSYLFHPRKMSMPIVSMVSDPKYFDDPVIGIHCVGNDPDNPNYGHDWRRPANVEIFFDENSEAGVNQLIETRIKGGWSRRFPLKSHVLYANKRFGQKRLEYEFFPDDCRDITEWKSLELRNAGNDFSGLYLRDMLIQRTFGRNVDVDWQPGCPTVFMLNGRFLGVLNLRSRSNEDYVDAIYGGLEDIDMIENWYELKAGTMDEFREFQKFYNTQGHTLEEYCGLMDVDEFMNVFIASIFFDNKDFPNNNIVMWRPRAQGGRWRWIMKDCDAGLGVKPCEPTYNTLEWLLDENYDPDITYGNSAGSTMLFRQLESLPDFRDRMIDRLSAYMGDFLSAVPLLRQLESMSSELDGELPCHFAALDIGGGVREYDEWRQLNMEIAREWIKGRVPFVYGMLSEHYGLGRPVPVSINLNGGYGAECTLNVNGTRLSGERYDGKWYVGRLLRVAASAKTDDTPVEGWEVTVVRNGVRETEIVRGARLEMAVPDCDELSIRTSSDLSGINDLAGDIKRLKAPLTVYDMTGRCLGTVDDIAAASSRFSGDCVIVIDSTGRSWKFRL